MTDEGSVGKNTVGNTPAEKKESRELFDFHGSTLPSSRAVNPKVQEIKQRCRRPAQINKELLNKLRHQKEAYKRWKNVQVSQEEYRDTNCLVTQGMKKSKWPQTQTQEILSRHKKKVFYSEDG